LIETIEYSVADNSREITKLRIIHPYVVVPAMS